MKLAKALALTTALTAAGAANQAHALDIQLFNAGGVEEGTAAYWGFTRAAGFWETVISSDVQVNLAVGFGQLGPNILGSTTSSTNVAYVGQVLPALQAKGNSTLDAIAAQNLPDTRPSGFIGGQAVDALISAPKANGSGVAIPLSRVLDNDAGANNSALSANTSLLKALGFTPTYAAGNDNQIDGSVTFSNQFNWDFDPTNGISSNGIDFIGVAIHEIGHALGFRSGVDTYDINTAFGGNIGGFAVMSIWDLFRYSEASAALGVNDWAIGGTGSTAPYFSIDGGQTVFNGDAYLSTGRNFGDGRQASHWKDNAVGQPQLGILDPTVAFGQQDEMTSLDLAAYDAMGWNIAFDVLENPDRTFSTRDINTYVPEPATWAMLVGGFFMLGGMLRSGRRQAVRVRI